MIETMSNRLGTDIIIRTPNPEEAAAFYEEHLGFKVTEREANLLSIRGENINLFIERGPAHGPVFEVFVQDVKDAARAIERAGGRIVLDEPQVPRLYVKDPYGLTYNLAPE